MGDWIFKTAISLDKINSVNSDFIITGSILLIVIHSLKLMGIMSPDELQIVVDLIHLTSCTSENSEISCPELAILKKCLANASAE